MELPPLTNTLPSLSTPEEGAEARASEEGFDNGLGLDEVSLSSDFESADDGEGKGEPEESAKSRGHRLLERAEGLKAAGNEALKKGDAKEATNCYKKGLKCIGKARKLKTEDDDADTDVLGEEEVAGKEEVVGKEEEDKYRACEKALALNLALSSLKTNEFFVGVSAASKVLGIEASNVKALMRRGVCHSRLSNYDAARTDLMRVLALEPNNLEARKELVDMRARAAQALKAEKSQFKGLFDRGALYEDKDAEMRRRLQREAEIERERVEEWKLFAEGFEDETLAPTYEAWRKEKLEKEREEQEKKEKEEKEKAKERQKGIAPIPSSASSSVTASATGSSESVKNGESGSAASPDKKEKKIKKQADSEVEFDEEDLKILKETKDKGYCYFRRELTEEEKARRAARQPQRLDNVTAQPEGRAEARPASQAGSPTAVSPGSSSNAGSEGGLAANGTPSASTTAGGVSGGISEWNATGCTYEEKDSWKWAKEMIATMLQSTTYESPAWSKSLSDLLASPDDCKLLLDSLKSSLDAASQPSSSASPTPVDLAEKLHPVRVTVSSKPVLEGEAQIMVVRGTKRFFYEFSTTLDFTVTLRSALGADLQKSAAAGSEVSSEKEKEVSSEKDRVVNGSIKITEWSAQSSEAEKRAELKRVSYKNKPSQIDAPVVQLAVQRFADQVIAQMGDFEKLYRTKA